MGHSPGSVFAEEAYAQGKMLDHSAWQMGEKLVRGITPSDVDMAIDNGGMIIFAELSSAYCEWKHISIGQRQFYENCIKGGMHCAVLCKHSIKSQSGKKIDTRNDIESFEVMVWDHGAIFSKAIKGNQQWQRFVSEWTETSYGPLYLRRVFIGKSTGLIVSPNGGISGWLPLMETAE